jgi:hypothetical protein
LLFGEIPGSKKNTLVSLFGFIVFCEGEIIVGITARSILELFEIIFGIPQKFA